MEEVSETETETPETTETEPEAAPVETPEEENPDVDQEEHLDGPGDDTEEGAPEAPPEPSSLAITEEQDKELVRETKRHTSAITRILGDSAPEAITCPFCNPDMQGFLFEGDLLHPRDELHAKMIEVLAPKPTVEYKHMPGFDTCEVCGGEGQGETGSNVPNYRLAVCPKCKGFGYLGPPNMGSNGGVTSEEVAQLVAVGGAGPIFEDTDNWGHPRLLADGRENPNYGKQPQYIDPNYP